MVIIAYDLGTGGVKAALYDDSLKVLAKSFMEYRTYFPGAGLHEQKPSDWWNGVVESTKQLLAASHTDPQAVGAVAISGQSLTAIPVDGSGAALLERVPIWSDGRAKDEARRFFETVDEERWYMTTGNGFPAPCYTIFKLMWMKAHQSEVFSNMKHVLGSKDYINYRMTGKILTDHSYASGTGGYNLKEARYQEEFWDAAGIDMDLLPKIVPSDTVVGYLTEQAARELGLTTKTAVMAGGVDNACMALGATGIRDGAAYISLGSSSWVPVTAGRCWTLKPDPMYSPTSSRECTLQLIRSLRAEAPCGGFGIICLQNSDPRHTGRSTVWPKALRWVRTESCSIPALRGEPPRIRV